MDTHYAQIVIGAPGAGKSTYCDGMQLFLSAIGRPVAVVNLDPANHTTSYPCAVDIRHLITVEDAMEKHNLGPNGAFIFCMEFLQANLEWLFKRLEKLRGKYVIFDCPGQVELFTHHQSLATLTKSLLRQNWRLAAVNLVDSYNCSDGGKYISATLVSLMMMLRLELPQVNVLSKIDLIQRCGDLAFGMSFFTQAMDLHRLLPFVNQHLTGSKGSLPADSRASSRAESYRSLTEALCEQVDEFGLVNFVPLNIEDKVTVATVLKLVDRAMGYLTEGSVDMVCKMQTDHGHDVRAKYTSEFGDADGAREEDHVHDPTGTHKSF